MIEKKKIEKNEVVVKEEILDVSLSHAKYESQVKPEVDESVIDLEK